MENQNRDVIEKNRIDEERRNFFWACRCGELLIDRDEVYDIDSQFIGINVRKNWFSYETFKQQGMQINCMKCGTKLLHNFHHPIILLKKSCLILKSTNEI